MHGRSFIAVIAAGGLALVFALLVPAAVVAEDVATAEQPAAPTPAANALPSATAPSSTATVPAPSAPNTASPTPPSAAAEPAAPADPEVLLYACLVALINTAMADAGILAWEQKYVYDYWRPVTGIREHGGSLGPEHIPVFA